MKKSQLRNIIRESIKDLLIEQTVFGHQKVDINVCDCQPSNDPQCAPGAVFSVGGPISQPSSTFGNPGSNFLCNGVACTPADLLPGQNMFEMDLVVNTTSNLNITFKLEDFLIPTNAMTAGWTTYMISSTCPSGPIIGCADPTITPCSSLPPQLVSQQCYKPNHSGCDSDGDGIGDPNDTTCCMADEYIEDPDLTMGTGTNPCTPPPGGCPPNQTWHGQPDCMCKSNLITIPPNLTVATSNTTPTCTNTDFSIYTRPDGSPDLAVQEAYNMGLANGQAYGILDGNSIFCTESCSFSNNPGFPCDCCGPLHCDTIISGDWIPYGCWACIKGQAPSCQDNGGGTSSGQNFYNSEPACLAQAPTNCPPPPPSPRKLPGSRERLQELAFKKH